MECTKVSVSHEDIFEVIFALRKNKDQTLKVSLIA